MAVGALDGFTAKAGVGFFDVGDLDGLVVGVLERMVGVSVLGLVETGWREGFGEKGLKVGEEVIGRKEVGE